MTTVSLFTSINYERPKSCQEKTLSSLSHYFYLGGNRARVIRDNEVRLVPGKISWYHIALKVASYVLLLPLTLTLLATHLCLRRQYHFSVIMPSTDKAHSLEPKSLSPKNVPKTISQAATLISTDILVKNNGEEIVKDEDRDYSLSILIEERPVISTPSSRHKSEEASFREIYQKEFKETAGSKTTLTPQNVKSAFQQVLPSSSLENKSLQQPGASVHLSSQEESCMDSLEEPKSNEERESITLDEFKRKIRFYDSYDKTPQQTAELFKNIPKCLDLGELVEFIFKECSPYKIPSFLEGVLIAHPSLTLSPFDQIRKAVIEDEDHSLNNNWLLEKLKTHDCMDKITQCYDFAYEMNHPYIYPKSQTIIMPSDYNLNFLWVNLNPQDRIQDIAQNIFKEGLDLSENATCIKDKRSLSAFEEKENSLKNEELENWNQIKKSFTYRISKWADVNPGSDINLWYDSALVTQKAQQKTFEMMKSISQSREVNLQLKDIRQLPNIEGEISNCLHPGTQLYYRVDLLKALITDYMMSSSEQSAKYCIVSDIDVEPMPPQQIFDQRTLDYLSHNGYVFNRLGFGDFENSFFIFNKEKKDLQRIHNEFLIQQAATMITELRAYPINTCFRPEYTLGAQSIYNLYYSFREQVGERRKFASRKVVKCPASQFKFGGSFSKSDYRAETFRFIGDSPIPYTRKGRNFAQWGHEEKQIEELIHWKAEPLSFTE